MEHRISHKEMDGALKQLEDDYVQAVKSNESTTVEDFIEQFLYDSWTYNDQNLEYLKRVLERYTSGDIYPRTFIGAFNEMVDHLQVKLEQLDQNNDYPALHSKHGASLLVAFVDGLVIQYYVGVYSVEQLREMTPYLKIVILQALKADAE
ncbi:hypothetical protein MUN89_05810 [Halobacillus salinarum]|uniref:Uncharacterized protein n=1 Tax=Halobacillus salinarum TaxID=2932257 RepID=A0ABY4END9_9BACI|nr:hypothetical protein [Halobacillus salinarum]UOQ45462.1 hypothetical protein MUN89_05810 [Halobacillus salinarum]